MISVWSLLHLSEAFSLLFSIFAILDPNCIALFGRTEELPSPKRTAAMRKINFSPSPLGNVKSTLSEIGKEFRNETTFSSRNGNLKKKEI